MAVINTNITALIGQQNLGRSQNALQTSMERLSSGLRINSAADDAAGQAIANRMTSAITGLNQAARNANDGISLAQTTEGALGQVNDNLQRIRELTVQAENGTNSQKDLQSIQNEISQRLSEIDRISRETEFNGVKVLAKDQDFAIQVGANDGQKITLNLRQMNSSTMSLTDFSVSGPQGSATASAASALVQAEFGSAITSITLNSGFVSGTSGDATAFLSSAASASASVVADADGNLFAKIDYTALTAADQEALAGKGIVGSGTTATAYVSLEMNDAAVNSTTSSQVDFTVTGMTANDLTAERSESPLAALDSAMEQVSSLRSELGAMQNRFDSAITNLNTTSTNLSAARSRIQDADYAVEVSNMTRAQILQQAGTSVLAQANQVPQSVLSLLG